MKCKVGDKVKFYAFNEGSQEFQFLNGTIEKVNKTETNCLICTYDIKVNDKYNNFLEKDVEEIDIVKLYKHHKKIDIKSIAIIVVLNVLAVLVGASITACSYAITKAIQSATSEQQEISVRVDENAENVHIENSYLINDEKTMRSYISEFSKDYEWFNKRSQDSYVAEWKAHNRLFYIGYETERTKSVDLNTNESGWHLVGYTILGA